MELRHIKQKAISKVAERMVRVIEEPPANASVKKPLEESTVALVSTAGILLEGDELFDIKNGDPSYRIIPDSASNANIAINHGHYDIKEALKDVNVVFPIERLKEFVEEGVIKKVAKHHYGLMGYIPQVNKLIKKSAPEIADQMVEDGVDVAILSPG